MIYFDNSATTAISPSALDTYIKTSQRIFGNPSSLHELGEQADRLLQQSRKQIASLLDVKANEIFFTSGGTEGDNWVIKGTAFEKKTFGKHILISAIEHPAVSESCLQLSKLGFEVEYIPVDESGFVRVGQLEQQIRPDTILVSVMAVNNEIGSIQPIAAISQLLRKYPTIHFHVDAVQAIGKIPRKEWLTSRVDFATFSAHKFHGPKGIGFIYWKEGRKLASLISGGGQESGQRSGTENVPGIVAMAKAARLLLEDEEKKQLKEAAIRAYLADSLQKFDKVVLFSSETKNYAPHILLFALRGVRGEVLVHSFEAKEIIISTTSACSSKKKGSSSTLRAMGVSENLATSAVRISLDETSTMSDAEQFMFVFKQLYRKFLVING